MAINSNNLENGTRTVATNGTAVNGKTVNGHEIESNGHASIRTNGATSTQGAVPVNGSNGHQNGADDYKGMIAVCGMALRLPGGLMKPQDFWDFLLAKGDARGRVPASRDNVDSYHSSTAQSGTVKTEHGYFLDDESVKLDSLDASLFSMPKAELERADPHQRQMLEVARECFEDAGVTGWGGSWTGCYILLQLARTMSLKDIHQESRVVHGRGLSFTELTKRFHAAFRNIAEREGVFTGLVKSEFYNSSTIPHHEDSVYKKSRKAF